MKISNLKKKLKIFAIVLMVLVVLSVIILFIVNGLKSKIRNFYELSEEIVINETYNTNFNRVTIKSTLSDIYIKNSLDNTSKIVVYGNSDLVSYNTNNNKLFINIKSKSCIGLCFKNQVSKIEVYLPGDYNKVIDIINEHGNIEIEKFENASFDIEEEYGNVLLEYSKFAKIDNEHGNIVLNNSKIARLNTSYGNIDINEVDDIEAESEHGNINIEKINNYLDLSNEYGNVKIKQSVLDKDSFIDVEYGDIKIYSISDVYIDAKTDLGDVKIKNNNKQSDIILKIRSDCGDIKIN